MKNKHIMTIIVILIIISLFLLIKISYKNNVENEFKSEYKGILTEIKIGSRGFLDVKIEGNTKNFYHLTYYGITTRNDLEVGDSICKWSYSRYLHLYKRKDSVWYLYEKYEM